MKSVPLRILAICLVVTNFVGSQNMTNNEIYKWFDEKIGSGNTGLYNGSESTVRYRTINGNHKYLETSNFIKGSINYDGQPYFDIEMRYDIYNDALIVKLPSLSAFLVLELIKEKVATFSLNGKTFVNTSSYVNENSKYKNDFFQLVYQKGGLKLFQKHEKERFDRRNQDRAYSEFKYRSSFFIAYQGRLTAVKSKRDVLKLLPEKKKEINAFYGRNRVSLNSNYDTFLIRLMNYLDVEHSTTSQL